jgi:hypothetical protein
LNKQPWRGGSRGPAVCRLGKWLTTPHRKNNTLKILHSAASFAATFGTAYSQKMEKQNLGVDGKVTLKSIFKK